MSFSFRAKDRTSLFLAVDIVLHGPTYFVIFYDAENLPPPYRIDNYSEVAISYYQTEIKNTEKRALIKPRTNGKFNLYGIHIFVNILNFYYHQLCFFTQCNLVHFLFSTICVGWADIIATHLTICTRGIQSHL